MRGTPPKFLSISLTAWDHPRVCGEHYRYICTMDNSTGSSPRMRGTRAIRVLSCSLRGIIPAYAGNTYHSFPRACRMRDHPRVCGEHFDSISALQRTAGSSPRMRGTQHYINAGLSPTGIIPAYAGNTSSVSFLVWRLTGSSPRMRGTPHLCRDAASGRGIIPAYAGNT